jgi:competence protein ComEC
LSYWIFAFITGLTWIYFYSVGQFSLSVPPELENKTILVQGKIVDDPIIKSHSTQFLFNTEPFGQVQINWYQHAPILRKNQIWNLSLRLKNPRNYYNPGGFDYVRYLFLNHISATGYVDERSGVELIQDSIDKISIRQQIAYQIDTVLQQRPQAALIKGLAVGLRDTMTDAQWELLQKTGTSHLLAISGLHVGLVAGLVFFLTRKIWAFIPRLPLFVPANIVAAFMAIIAALIYSALAGFSLPTQRALIMITVAMLCICTRYQFRSSDILAFAALIVVIIDPFASMSASFWLSFSAVWVLIMLSRQQMIKWRAALQIQLAISIALTPLVIVYFQQISWISPLANFVAIPWASFTVVPLTLLGVAGSFIDLRLASLFWLLAESALNFMEWFLHCLTRIPFAWQEYVINDTRVWLALGLGSILILLPHGLPGKSLGCILLCAVFFVRPPKPEVGEVWFSVLDVGQGLASVVQTANHVLIYDAGMRFDEFDLGQAVVLPFLKHQGIKKIDTLILSHDNLDHTGGAPYLINNMPVMRVISGEPIAALDVKQRCRLGDRWVWDDIVFEFLFPYKLDDKNSNNNSCVLKISAGENSILLTGDIEQDAEKWLVENNALQLASTILVAPHHGSRTSSTLSFVQATQPKFAIFTTGYLNQYNFPRIEVTLRYSTRGAQILNTADTGAIIFKFSAQTKDILPQLFHKQLNP